MQVIVSVIMPCYNQAQYLPEALESLFAQTYSYWECIVVSDGSPDNIREVIQEYIEKDDRIKFYDTENGGVSAARNYAIEKAVGTYILPLDSDDKISENYIERCVHVLSTFPSVTVVYGNGRKFGIIEMPWNFGVFGFKELLINNSIHCSGMYRRVDCISLGGYDVNMKSGLEDWEFWINMLKKGGEVILLDEIVFYWRIKEISRTKEITKQTANRLIQYIYCKHAELYEELFGNPIDLYKQYKSINDALDNIRKQPFRFALKNLLRKWVG
ncbi:glycosyltransferase [soil metagenome]